jgi:hypothetical protein
MAKRSISDVEIALIKTMLTRGLKNKDIQFFFNRPDRPVNTGRISTIRTGSYSNSSSIPAATDADLDSFIADFGHRATSVSAASASTTLTDVVRALFEKRADGSWHLKSGESEEHECKQEFDLKKLTTAVRAIAALANNKGGFLFFRVSNKEYRVEGVGNIFAETDVVRIIEKVKAHLSPTPSITAKEVIEIGGKKVGVIKVERHPDRPIIVYRDGDGLNEGEILFRYAGQSSRIKFGDLRAMLEERDRRAQVALASAAKRLADVGTANALIIDTERNVLEGEGRSILIDEKLVDSIKFIEEGKFDQTTGGPTLKLVGKVSAVTVNAPGEQRISREAIFQEHIMEDFLTQAKVDQPIQYIIAGLAQSRQWLPVFYFVRLAGETNTQVAKKISALRISQRGKKKVLIDRLEGRKSALTKAVTRAAKRMAADISKGVIVVPSVAADVSTFAYGLTAVNTTKATLGGLLAALHSCRDLAERVDDGNALGAVFKAACRVDEIFFK